MSEPNSIPTLREELDRKSLTELVRLLTSNKRGELSSAELRVAAQTMWGTTAGLVDESIMNMMSQTILSVEEGQMFTEAEIENADLLGKMDEMRAENAKLRLRLRELFMENSKVRDLQVKNEKMSRVIQLLRGKLDANQKGN